MVGLYLAMKHTVTLPDPMWTRCNAYGRAVVDSYQRGMNARSRALVVEGREPIHNNPKVQMWGKVFEVGFCLWADIDPERLDWTQYADNGSDIKLGEWEIDVKGSPSPHATALIWPVSKTKIFEEVGGNAFVFCRRANNFQPVEIEIVGWASKTEFRNCHEVAEPGNRRNFTPGTWFMEARHLQSPESLLRELAA